MSESIQLVNRMTTSFNKAMTDAMMSENRDDLVENMKSMSVIFTELCSLVECYAEQVSNSQSEIEKISTKCQSLQMKADSHDDIIAQLHMVLNAKNQSKNKCSDLIFNSIATKVNENLKTIHEFRSYKARYDVERERTLRMSQHIDFLSKIAVMQRIGSRFFAREVAAIRQMMDLVRNSQSIEWAAKSKVWEEIEAENQLLRVNTLWLINRINSNDRNEAPYENELSVHSPPRIVILMRTHHHQGLGLEITGGCDSFRPVIVSGKLKGSMADDDELRIGDRIIAIDGNFVTNTTSHGQVMQLLKNESSKDYLALVVSAFDPWKDENRNEIDKDNAYKNIPSLIVDERDSDTY